MMRKILVLLAIVVFCPLGFASQVLKIRGHSALVDLGGEPGAPGDLFFTVDQNGKRRGIIRLVKVKGSKAIAHLLRGRMLVGMTLEMRPAPVTQAPQGPTFEQIAQMHNMYWGGLVGAAYDSMSVNVLRSGTTTPLKTTSITGQSFSLKGMFDYKLVNHLWFRGSAGAEGFSVAGDNVCGAGNSSTCNANLWYLSFDMVGRYIFKENRWRPWAGGGIEVLFPLSKSSSAIDPSSISNTTVFVGAVGMDYFLNPKMYIPVSLEYGLFPKSDQVSANWIALRIGVCVPF